MTKARLEAFSDGVVAIIITIMVLELRAPHSETHSATLADLQPLWPVFLSYVLSYVNVGMYWANHHHMLHAAQHATGRVLWTNLHLLFWLSLVPFTTAWMGENHFAPWPVAAYGFVLLMAAFAYVFLQQAIVAADGPQSPLARAVGADRKGLISRLMYMVAIPAAFLTPWISGLLYVAVALMWIIPDRRLTGR